MTTTAAITSGRAAGDDDDGLHCILVDLGLSSDSLLETPKVLLQSRLVRRPTTASFQRLQGAIDAGLVERNDVKFAREAIVSQVTEAVSETCVICIEDTDVEHIFSVDGCGHRYCLSCLKRHVEAKLLHGIVPKCPHYRCKSELAVESSNKFLTSKLIETMSERIKEASIPAEEKIYCPDPRCAALMSKHGIPTYIRAHECVKCRGLFCINCKVRWHENLTCAVYKWLHPNPPEEDVKLKSLASENRWRQCVKCNHMIELARGCNHMACRCGCEFCYNCGAEWKNERATCSCPRFGAGDDEL